MAEIAAHIVAPTVHRRDRSFTQSAWGLSAILWAAMAIFFWNNEWPWLNFVYSMTVTAGLIALLAAITGRVLIATILAAAQVVIVSIAAQVKLKTMDMLVHAYDLYFYFRSWSTIEFLAEAYPLYVYGLVGALALSVLLAALVYMYDGARVTRWKAAIASLLLFMTGAIAIEALGERRHWHLFFRDRYLSTYYGSVPETLRTVWRGQLIEAATQAPGTPFAPRAACSTPRKKPHIILIHQESIVPPSHFAELEYDRSIDPYFKSHDGKLHKLRVETYGGASWLTEFSVLAGVSTYSFGTMRQFVQSFMAGKVKETVTEKLAECGYRNILFYPVSKNFVSNARFYEAIGLKEIFDMKDQKASSLQERDQFYYSNAVNEIERHIKNSGTPLFTYIQTMAAHWPYDTKLFPDENVPGGASGIHPELHEYLRRVSLSARDYQWLLAELKRRMPNESFVIVSYGDHQPSATRMLLGQKDETEVEDITLAAEGPGFLTYYSVMTQNWNPPAMYNLPVLDVPYLGLVLFETAGLPLSEAWKERRRLMLQCNGRYHTCADTEAILGFHRRLIDSGIMDSR